MTSVAPSPHSVPPPAQSLQEKGDKDFLVLNSPYGTQQQRNGAYGWGTLFQSPKSAVLPPHLSNIRIGISSLNGVPGNKDRRMPTLLAQYRKKFNCLEHCYPYHRVGDAAAWASWAAMVCESNAPPRPSPAEPTAATAANGAKARSEVEHQGTNSEVPVLQPARFLYTVKANKLLTHEKLAALDPEVEAHIDHYFTQCCRQLEPFLGPILVQFPPFFQCSQANLTRLERLAGRLPQDEVCYRLSPSAKDCRAGGGEAPSDAVVHRRRRVRVAVEFRDRSWYTANTFALLRKIGWALVVAHHHDDATFASHVDTGVNFMYVRLHGPVGKNTGDYGREQLRLWAEQIARFVRRKDTTAASPAVDEVDPEKEVFVFLNNSDSQVGGTTSSIVDATCLAEEVAKLFPSPVPSPATAPPVTSASRAKVPVVEVNVDSPPAEGAAQPEAKRSRQEDPVAVRAESILDVDEHSSGTIIVD